jgi:hypothetical protein
MKTYAGNWLALAVAYDPIDPISVRRDHVHALGGTGSMHGNIEYWDGNDWEDHVLRLLQDMHGAENVQPVPATHKGDCGIDYFCVNKGIVYQCYACEGPIHSRIEA